jgi:hypothetical protein
MPPQESEQFLEWTAKHHFSGMYVLHFIGSMIFMLILSIPVSLIPSPFPPGALYMDGKGPIIVLVVFPALFGVLLIIMCILPTKRNKMPSRTLRVERQSIILTDNTVWKTKERRMDSVGAKICAVHQDFFSRLFLTLDMYQMDTAYYIEISRNGETLLFPCRDEWEQSRIIKQIKELITSRKS